MDISGLKVSGNGQAPPQLRGYSTVPLWVTFDLTITLAGYRVLGALIALCPMDRRACRASTRQLATMLGLARNTVKRALHELVEAKLIACAFDEKDPREPRLVQLLFDPRGGARVGVKF